MLQIGMTGEDVKAMQLALNKHLRGSGTLGPKIGDGTIKPLVPDGVFGPAMERLVRAFQTANGLTENGEIDQPTRYAIFPMGVLSVVVTVNRLTRPWLLAPRDPSWARPPRLLPRLQLSDDRSPLAPIESGRASADIRGASAGKRKRPYPPPATSLDMPWLLQPRQPAWRSPPVLVPPLKMPVRDPAPRPAPITANMDGRSLSPGSRTLDLSRIDWDSSKWIPRRPTIDCSNIDWPMHFPKPLVIDWSKVHSWQDDGSVIRLLARPFSDMFPAPVMPSPAAAHEPDSDDSVTVLDHDELQYGSQLSWLWDGTNWTKPRAAILSYQLVYRKGPDDGPHSEGGFGFQLAKPLNVVTGDGDSVSINPYFYYSHVDSFWHFGKLHLVQPLAQVGFQVTPKSPQKFWNPTLTGAICPINVEYDPSDWLKVNLQGCGVANYGLDDGSFVTGAQASATMTISLAKIYGSLRSLFPDWFHTAPY
jgi:hypothetical protein